MVNYKFHGATNDNGGIMSRHEIDRGFGANKYGVMCMDFE